MSYLVNPYIFSSVTPALAQYLYIGTFNDTSFLSKYSSVDGVEVTNGWPNENSIQPTCVAVGSDGGVVMAGGLVGENTTRKYSKDGVLLWSANHGTTVLDIDVDSDNNVITVGLRIGNVTTRKYNSDGTLLWSVDHGTTVRGVAVDSLNNIITVGSRTSNLTTRKYNSSGALQWSRDHGATLYSVGVDSLNNIITGGGLSSNITTRKYNSTGTLQWSRNHTTDASKDIICDSNNNIFVGGVATATDVAIRKYNASGTELATITLPANRELPLKGLCVDLEDNFYYIIEFTSPNRVQYIKMTNDLSTVIWSQTFDNNAQVRGAAISPLE